MARKDIKSRTQLDVQIVKAAKTDGTVTATGTEVADFEGVLFVVDAGAWTDGTHTAEFQESDTLGSGYTAIADVDLDGSEPVVDDATDDDQTYYIGYHGNKQYVRVVLTTASATTGAIIGAYVIKGLKKVFS